MWEECYDLIRLTEEAVFTVCAKMPAVAAGTGATTNLRSVPGLSSSAGWE